MGLWRRPAGREREQRVLRGGDIRVAMAIEVEPISYGSLASGQPAAASEGGVEGFHFVVLVKEG